MGLRSVEKLVYDSNQKDLATAINQADSAAELTQLDPVEEIKSGAVKVFSDRRNLRFGAPNFSWAFGP